MALNGICAAILLTFAGSSQEVKTIIGTAAFRERIALPPGAVFEATLEDVSRAGAPAEVLGRVRMEKPGSPPFRFSIQYDPSRIVESHTYSVRARVLAGDRLMFTTDQQYPVLTHGNGNEVTMMLMQRPPVSSLGELPASFTGQLPCADCPGIRYVLNLFPGQSYYMQMTYLERNQNKPRDELGRWNMSEDGKRLTLYSCEETRERFAIRGPDVLRILDVQGQEIQSTLNFDLRRTASFERIEPRLEMSGMFQYMADAATFRECRSGQRWPVAMEKAYKGLESAYTKVRRQPGEEMMASVEGQVAMRPGMDRPVPTLVVERFTGVWPGETCGAPLAASPLEETYWKLTRLEGNPVTVAERQREPHIVLRKQETRVTGFGGCNNLTGSYRLSGHALIFGAIAATQMACPQGMDTEAAFFKALGKVRMWKIAGEHLELFDDGGNLVARFEGRALR